MGIFPSNKLSRDVLTVFEKVVDEDPIGINSPVAFFLTFTRYQYANVIPVLKFVVWYKFILHLTVMFTYSHTY